MILWHLGTTLTVLWFTFRGNPRLDYRVAAVGALLPDLVDKPIGRVLFASQLQSGRLWGHALLPNVLVFAILFFMRGRSKRQFVLLPIGSLLHLAEDGMWSTPHVFWWPLLGWAMPHGRSLGLWETIRGSWLQESIGAVLLVWLLAAHGLLSPRGVTQFLRTGRLEAAKQ